MLATACTDDAGTGTEESPPPTEESAPPAETAPETTASGGENTDGGQDDLSSEDWIVIGILGLGVAGVLFVVTSMTSNRSRKKAAAQLSLNRDLDRVIGGTRWVHDQGSLEVLNSSSPDQLRSVWMSVRDRIVDLEAETATLSAGVTNSRLERSLSYLGQCLAGLRGALESNVAARLDSGADREAKVEGWNQAVYDRRPELLAAIEPISAAR